MLFKPILALHIMDFSSCQNYWGGENDVCPPPLFTRQKLWLIYPEFFPMIKAIVNLFLPEFSDLVRVSSLEKRFYAIGSWIKRFDQLDVNANCGYLSKSSSAIFIYSSIISFHLFIHIIIIFVFIYLINLYISL